MKAGPKKGSMLANLPFLLLLRKMAYAALTVRSSLEPAEDDLGLFAMSARYVHRIVEECYNQIVAFYTHFRQAFWGGF
jgi:hypothetical protein